MLVLHSFDIGNATDTSAIYGFDLTLVRDSDSNTVWSHATASFNPGGAETVNIDYTGGFGESYTLNFDRNPAGSFTSPSGIDNLSFSQIPPVGDTAIAQGIGGGVDLTWTSGSAGTYMLLEKTSLAVGNWSTNQSGIAGGATNTTVTVPATQDAAFFKASLE